MTHDHDTAGPPQEDQELELAPIIPGRNPRSWTMTEAAPVVSPLVAYMTAETTPERDAAFLRMYAARVLDRTASSWEIPNTVATTLQDIANRIELAAPVVTQEGE